MVNRYKKERDDQARRSENLPQKEKDIREELRRIFAEYDSD